MNKFYEKPFVMVISLNSEENVLGEVMSPGHSQENESNSIQFEVEETEANVSKTSLWED